MKIEWNIADILVYFILFVIGKQQADTLRALVDWRDSCTHGHALFCFVWYGPRTELRTFSRICISGAPSLSDWHDVHDDGRTARPDALSAQLYTHTHATLVTDDSTVRPGGNASARSTPKSARLFA